MTRRHVTLIAWGLAGLCSMSACRKGGTTAVQDTPTETPSEVTVTVAPIVRTTLHGYVTGWGKVEPESATRGNPPANAAIAAPTAGLVTAILCSEGERVRQGATLFRLDSRIADVAVERAKQAVRFAEGLVERQEQLGPGQATSQRAYQEAKQQLTAAQSELNTAEVQRRLLDVTAPIDGTVMRINARLGDATDPSKVLAEIIDLSRLVANAAIRSVDARQVKPGQRIDLSPGASPGVGSADAGAPRITATIEYIASQVDSATDTVLVRARVPVTSGLRPGQFVNVSVAVDERPNRLAVPVESVVQGADGPEIALVQGDTAVRTRVTTGLREGSLVEVAGEGVSEGIPVVVQGAYGLPPRTKVKISGR
jgi:membrane fusion protein (multidrug efflux system)